MNLNSLLFAILFLSWQAQAALTIPGNLNGEERQRITEILGLSTSSKMVGNPYPLGGYSGVELGLGIESVNTEDLNHFGNHVNQEKDFTYPLLSVGKGLYNNTDIFLHFIPYTQSAGFSEYGGLLRVGLYQAAFIPATLGLILHANSTNIGNVFFSQSRGIELVTGLNAGHFSLYLGGGQIQASGRFSRAVNAVNPDQQTAIDESNLVAHPHWFAGGSFDIEPYFVAIQIDQYTQTMFSGKLGLRF